MIKIMSEMITLRMTNNGDTQKTTEEVIEMRVTKAMIKVTAKITTNEDTHKTTKASVIEVVKITTNEDTQKTTTKEVMAKKISTRTITKVLVMRIVKARALKVHKVAHQVVQSKSIQCQVLHLHSKWCQLLAQQLVVECPKSFRVLSLRVGSARWLVSGIQSLQEQKLFQIPICCMLQTLLLNYLIQIRQESPRMKRSERQ